MRKLMAGLLALMLVTAAGCGGGDDGTDCGDVAARIVECFDEDPATAREMCEMFFDVTVCEGSKQAALDCVVASECVDLEDGPPATCMEQEGCTFVVE